MPLFVNKHQLRKYYIQHPRQFRREKVRGHLEYPPPDNNYLSDDHDNVSDKALNLIDIARNVIKSGKHRLGPSADYASP